ncbi:MAG: hypothetical protein PHI12_14845 [Dehalococcoidales bacterium]|jgi:hypothetical protein|nr:hypothetical protein [Sphaerochaeta sp.]MDD5512064.1 hypothetical protein [Dehalococcoidales bacterium]
MNEKLREAIDKWQLAGYGPGYWDGYIQGMVAANPELGKERIIWVCIDCGLRMTDVAFNSFSKPCCRNCASPIVIDEDPRYFCCSRLDEFIEKGAISRRGGRFWLTTHYNPIKVEGGVGYAFWNECSSVIEHCPFCGADLPNEVDNPPPKKE